MLKKVNPIFVLFFLLGVGAFSVFETLLSFQASKCSPNEQSQNTSAPKSKKPSSGEQGDHGGAEHGYKAVSEPFICSIGGFPTATRVFMNQNEGFFIGSFTLLLAIGTAWLVWATIKLWRGAEDTAQRQLRAYVVVTGAEPDFDRAGDLTVSVTLTNCGQTPAYNVSVSREIGLFNRKNPQFPKAEGGTSKFTLAAGQPMAIELVLKGVSGVMDMRGDRFDGDRSIYIFGEATYHDIFRRKIRRTPYNLIFMQPKPGRCVVTPTDYANDPD